MKKSRRKRRDKRKETKSPISTDTHCSFCSAWGNQSKLIRKIWHPNSLCSSNTHNTHIQLTPHISSLHLITDIMLRDTVYAVVQVDYSNDNSLITFGLHLLRSSPSLTFLFESVCACVNSLFFCLPSVSLSVAPPQHHLQRVFDITCAICLHTQTHTAVRTILICPWKTQNSSSP